MTSSSVTPSHGSGSGARRTGTGTTKTPLGCSSYSVSSNTGTMKTPSCCFGLGASASTDTMKTSSDGLGASFVTGTTKTPLGSYGASSGTGTMKTILSSAGVSSGTTKTLSGCSGSGFGSGSYLIQSSGSEEDLQHIMDQRKKNRKISNRESARRSRKRKQKHLDDLATQLSQLRKANNEMISSVNITTQQYMNVETENRVLRARMAELNQQLQSLNDIIAFMYPSGDSGCGFVEELYTGTELVDEFMSNSLSYVYANQPILASADMFM